MPVVPFMYTKTFFFFNLRILAFLGTRTEHKDHEA